VEVSQRRLDVKEWTRLGHAEVARRRLLRNELVWLCRFMLLPRLDQNDPHVKRGWELVKQLSKR